MEERIQMVKALRDVAYLTFLAAKAVQNDGASLPSSTEAGGRKIQARLAGLVVTARATFDEAQHELSLAEYCRD